tara:strand:- start:234 stop:491 length:258 start_codon:yes stop_codon:yes gene_type:complete
MKNFFYKTLFLALVFFILFKITFGSLINKVDSEIRNLNSKENVELVKEKLREEMRKAIEKEDYINDDDAELIKKFFLKIKSETNL